MMEVCPECLGEEVEQTIKVLRFRTLSLGKYAVEVCKTCGEVFVPEESYRAASQRLREILDVAATFVLESLPAVLTPELRTTETAPLSSATVLIVAKEPSASTSVTDEIAPLRARARQGAKRLHFISAAASA